MIYQCWGKSFRGCDYLLTQNLNLGNQRLLNPIVVLGMCPLFVLPMLEAAQGHSLEIVM